jgi:hypothetical protein
MGMLGTDDPVKGQLLKKSALHREQLEEDVKIISESTEKIIINALVVGGALAATYFLVSRLSGSKSKQKKTRAAKIKLVQGGPKDEESYAPAIPETPGMISQITTALASQATVFLLSLAKEKLVEFLQAQSEKKAKANGTS